MYSSYLFAVLCWIILSCIYLYLNTYVIKLTRNCLSATHASIVVLAYLLNIPGHTVFYVSCGYYILDGSMEVGDFITNRRLQNCLMIFHHIISVYGLSYLFVSELYHHIYYAFFLIEVSNFPIYIVYYLKTIRYPNQCVIMLAILLEISMSFSCRMILGLKHLIHMYNTTPGYELFICTLGVLLYSLSALWLLGMCLQLKLMILVAIGVKRDDKNTIHKKSE